MAGALPSLNFGIDPPTRPKHVTKNRSHQPSLPFEIQASHALCKKKRNSNKGNTTCKSNRKKSSHFATVPPEVDNQPEHICCKILVMVKLNMQKKKVKPSRVEKQRKWPALRMVQNQTLGFPHGPGPCRIELQVTRNRYSILDNATCSVWLKSEAMRNLFPLSTPKIRSSQLDVVFLV